MRIEECEIIKKATENGLASPLQFNGKCEGFDSDGREVPVSACEQCDLCTINNSEFDAHKTPIGKRLDAGLYD